jgi:hypothetical protein
VVLATNLRVLFGIIGFINTFLNHIKCRAIVVFHNLQFTLAYALGFSVSTSRLLGTDLNTDAITSNHYEVFLSSTNFPWLSPPGNSVLTSSAVRL